MIVSYKHHGHTVFVDERLKGRHREFCLCYKCDRFHPEAAASASHCPIADVIFQNCVQFNIVTPVWECPAFVEKK
jgi:hypothetical protein